MYEPDSSLSELSTRPLRSSFLQLVIEAAHVVVGYISRLAVSEFGEDVSPHVVVTDGQRVRSHLLRSFLPHVAFNQLGKTLARFGAETASVLLCHLISKM